MAIITLSVLLNGIRNSVGNVTFTKGAFGPVARERVSPTNPNTSRQSTVRTNFTAVAAAWKSLTSAQRSAWTAYASGISRTNALGVPVTILGLNASIASNTLLLLAGQAQRSAAPTTSGLSAPAGYTGDDLEISAGGNTIASGEITASFSSFAADTDDIDLLVFVGQGRSASVNYYQGPYRLAGVVAGNTSSPPTTFSLTLPYSASAGQLMRVRFVQVFGTTGQMVSEDIADLTVAA